MDRDRNGGATIFRRIPALWALGSVLIVAVGAVIACVRDRSALHDSYRTDAYFHLALIFGAGFMAFAGIYRWFPRITGLSCNAKLAQAHFWLMFAGVSVTMLPQLFLQSAVPPSGIAEVRDSYVFWNFVSEIGAYITMAGLAVFMVTVAEALLRKRMRGDDG